MNDTLRRIAFLSLLALVSTLAACNTIKGAGRDIESAGEEIQEEANDAADAE